MVSAPFRANFMLPVPLASLPAVEICSERSEAGKTRSASETRELVRKTTRSLPLTAGSLLTTEAPELISLMISLAVADAGAAFPPQVKVRGKDARPGHV